MEFIGQLRMVDAEAVQDCCVDVVDVRRPVHHVVAEVVGLAVDRAAARAAAGQPPAPLVLNPNPQYRLVCRLSSFDR